MEIEVTNVEIPAPRNNKIDSIINVASELCDADMDTLIDFARRLMRAHTQEVFLFYHRKD